MARIKNNLFLQGASGMLGKQLVYKTVDGKIIVSARPVRSGEVPEVQKKQNMRFKYASIFAKSVVEDKTLGPIYTEAAQRLKRFKSTYQLALTDYLKAPEIGDITIESGLKDSPILVEAFEDPKLAKVEISILANDDSVTESGEAELSENGIQWRYVLQNDIPEGGKVAVKAFDLPGNESDKTFEVGTQTTNNATDT